LLLIAQCLRKYGTYGKMSSNFNKKNLHMEEILVVVVGWGLSQRP